jgi:L-ascorbate metabolism protein UlaG (beta-lactamase superfamily)
MTDKLKPVFVALACSLLYGCGPSIKYSLSDHYDGRKFSNPSSQEEPGLWDTVKMLASLSYTKWPDPVENKPALNLGSTLGSDQVAITFVNHATVLIQLPGLNILTDPVWSERVSPHSWFGPKRVRKPGIPFDSLPRIDLVIVSHNHYDHMDLDALKRLHLRFSPRMLVPLGNKAILESEGIEKVEEMEWWDTTGVNLETSITFTPTQHFSSRGLLDRNKTLWGSFVINFQGRLIYFGGDAGYSAHFKEIRNRFGSIDIALLPIGGYEPRWFMKAYHMNPSEAVQAHLDLESRQSIGIHFGTFQLTEEAIDAPVRDLGTALTQTKLDPRSFVTLPEGVTTLYSTRPAGIQSPRRPLR